MLATLGQAKFHLSCQHSAASTHTHTVIPPLTHWHSPGHARPPSHIHPHLKYPNQKINGKHWTIPTPETTWPHVQGETLSKNADDMIFRIFFSQPARRLVRQPGMCSWGLGSQNSCRAWQIFI